MNMNCLVPISYSNCHPTSFRQKVFLNIQESAESFLYLGFRRAYYLRNDLKGSPIVDIEKNRRGFFSDLIANALKIAAWSALAFLLISKAAPIACAAVFGGAVALVCTNAFLNLKRIDRASLFALAERGHPESMFKLGKMYDEGICIEQNDNLAILWYNKAMLAGHIEACYPLYYLTKEIADDSELKNQKLRECLEKAAAGGHSAALNDLGNAYRKGLLGFKKDEKKALDYYRKAAMLLDPNALINLGFLSSQEVNEEVLKYLKKAAELGSGLGMVYYADAVEDKEIETYWYKKAAEIGTPLGMLNYGVLLREGDGVTKNIELGYTFVDRAANAGLVEAMFELELFKDLDLENIESLKTISNKCWRAANKGYEPALELLIKLGNAFTSFQEIDIVSKKLIVLPWAYEAALKLFTLAKEYAIPGAEEELNHLTNTRL